MKHIVLTVISLLAFHIVFSQGTIRGKVTNESGETLVGVSVIVKSDPTVGAYTDLNGDYSLKINKTEPQILVISYIGCKIIEETVNPLHNEVLIKDFTLISNVKAIKQVTVTAKQTREKSYYMENIKKKSATTIDYISSESMKRLGDNNVANAVVHVSGVSTNGSFFTVRGIGDRYIKTTINGAQIPTLDPFTNNIKLDLIPASLVDNIIITKTANPDQTGDWAGAYISVETKDFPEKLAVNIETTIGYNDQSTLKNVISSQRSSTDWLGYDNNFRDRDHNNFIFANFNPSQYQVFNALGLGSYYNSMGITQQNWGEGTATGELNFKLGLVKLGLLPSGLIDDASAIKEAKSLFLNGNYQANAIETINSKVGESAKSFPDNWNTDYRKAPLNFSQSFSVGNQVKLFGRNLGFIAGFRYGSSTIYDPASVLQRARFDKTLSSSLEQQISKETNGWSALFNMAYKLNENNSISLLFMPNLSGVNNVRHSEDVSNPSEYIITNSQFYEQRRQLVYQYKSEHYVKSWKLRMKLNASYTQGKSTAPDFKNLQYYKDPISNTYQIGGTIGDGIHRYYRYLNDNIFDSKISFELPIMNSATAGVRKLIFGGSHVRNDRKSEQYDYEILSGQYAYLHPLTSDNIDEYFSPDKFQLQSGTDVNGKPYSAVDYYYSENRSDADRTFGYSRISSGFAAVDYSITPIFRISGGLRIEKAIIFTDVFKYDSLGYKADDPRRDYSAGVNPIANPGKLNELSYLPSANFIYKMMDNSKALVNLRLNYSQTVARPSIRELSDVAVFDYEFRSFVFGNSNLKMVKISNYDVRAESFFKNGDNISASLFYKNFKNHIELINAGTITWENVDKSYVAGIELEGRKGISKHFEFRSNITIVKSNTSFIRKRLEIEPGGYKNYIPEDAVKRPMFGQAPFIVNGIVSYNSDSLGLIVTLSYNVQGERLVVASNVKEIPDVYELPRHLFDIKVSKKIGKHFGASFTVKDILNSKIRRSYKYPEGYIFDFDSYRYGTNFSIGLSYKI